MAKSTATTISDCLGLRGFGEGWGVIANGYRASSWGDDNVLESVSGDRSHFCEHTKNHLLTQSKNKCYGV